MGKREGSLKKQNKTTKPLRYLLTWGWGHEVGAHLPVLVLLPHESRGSDSGRHTWWQTPLLADLTPLPKDLDFEASWIVE